MLSASARLGWKGASSSRLQYLMTAAPAFRASCFSAEC